jgi:hypothetical protein
MGKGYKTNVLQSIKLFVDYDLRDPEMAYKPKWGR